MSRSTDFVLGTGDGRLQVQVFLHLLEGRPPGRLRVKVLRYPGRVELLRRSGPRRLIDPLVRLHRRCKPEGPAQEFLRFSPVAHIVTSNLPRQSSKDGTHRYFGSLVQPVDLFQH